MITLPPDVRITPSVAPLSEAVSWADAPLGIEDAWRSTKGENIRVAILDTGIDTGHPDLEGAFHNVQDFTRSRWGAQDRHGHGTHVASLVGARSGNDIGIRGIAPLCKLLCAKVLGDSGAGSEDSIMAGVRWSYDQGAWVISMSLGGPDPMPRLASLIAEIVADAKQAKRPLAILAAAGNDGGNALNYPAALQGVFPVGAFGANGKITRFTSRSERLRVLGPGVEMLGCLPGNRYGAMTGTSQATPIVAAIVALALRKEKEVGSETKIDTSADAEDHIARNSVDSVNGNKFKLVNARKAIEAIGEKPVDDRVCGRRLFGLGRYVLVDTAA